MEIDFKKGKGLVPVIIQDTTNLEVLMLGYMNKEAYLKTKKEKKVTFFARSKNRLWTKGETSGNYLWVDKIFLDCDKDTLLIHVKADGPVCHTGNKSCFNTELNRGFLYQLEKIIGQRIDEDVKNSYSNNLFQKGINKVAQKVGEEAVEVIIEAKDDNADLFQNEVADLLYHLLILLKVKNHELFDIEKVLKERHYYDLEFNQ